MRDFTQQFMHLMTTASILQKNFNNVLQVNIKSHNYYKFVFT